MSQLERARFRALALKVETTPGTDAIAGTPAAADWVDAQFQISPDYVVTPDPSFTGSLDPRPGVVGGGRFMVQGVRVPLRGSGTAGTEPEWFRVLRSAGMAVTNTATAIGAPTAATAGTATTATLATPFAATGDLYRGMPITLSGNPATARTTLITDYTVGRVATFARTFSAVLTTSTLAQIPINNLLRLTDDETNFVRLTAYAYEAGRLFIGLGCVAVNPRIRLTAAGMGMLEFDLMGVSAGVPAETTLPAGAAAVSRPTPPTWRDGECQLGRALVRGAEAVVGLGAAAMLPANPENANGFDVAELMTRNPTAEVTCYANSTASPGRETAMRNGTDTVFSAIIGTAAGNRIGLLFSPGRITNITSAEREGADVETYRLEPALAGGSVMISAF
ncbi:hypothetical protein [Synechococcus phage MinM1]|nr:hypothetical protein [Synechococcus phage MinM1]